MAYSLPFISGLYALGSVSIYTIQPHLKVQLPSDFPESRPVTWIWRHTLGRLGDTIPAVVQVPLSALVVVAVILLGTFLSPQSADNNYGNRAISLAGLILIYAILYLTSAHRRKIVWRTVIVGLLLQYILALFVLRTQVGYDIFNFVSFLARYLQDVCLLIKENYSGLPIQEQLS